MKVLELRRTEKTEERKDAKTNQGDFFSYFLIFRQHWRRQQEEEGAESLIEIQKTAFCLLFLCSFHSLLSCFLTAWFMLFAIERNISIS